MCKLPKIIVLDDQQIRLDNAEIAYNLLNFSCGIELIQPSFYAYNNADSYLRNVIGSAIILLDLGFRDSDNQEIPELERNNLALLSDRCGLEIIKDASNSIKGISFKSDKSNHIIEGARIDGISLIEPILANDKIDFCIVIICSGLGNLNHLSNFIEKFTDYARKANLNITFMRDKFGRDLSDAGNAQTIFEELPEIWAKYYPEFHCDHKINNAIDSFSEAYNNTASCKKSKWPFHHDEIEDNESFYKNIASHVLKVEPDIFSTKNSLKSLLCLNSPAISIDFPKTAFSDWPLKASKLKEKPFPAIQAEALLSKWLDIQVHVEGDNTGNIRFPIRPALPFLISLRHFLLSLNKENLRDKNSANVSLVSTGSEGYLLTIPLSSTDHSNSFKLATRWTEKITSSMDTSQATIRTGICGYLWDLLHARTPMCFPQADTNLGILKIFLGLDRPIMGVHFAPFYIHLYWN